MRDANGGERAARRFVPLRMPVTSIASLASIVVVVSIAGWIHHGVPLNVPPALDRKPCCHPSPAGYRWHRE